MTNTNFELHDSISVNVYVDDELEELLVLVNGALEVCIHSLKKRECEWYTHVYVLYPFDERRGSVSKIHMFLFDTHSSKGERE